MLNRKPFKNWIRSPSTCIIQWVSILVLFGVNLSSSFQWRAAWRFPVINRVGYFINILNGVDSNADSMLKKYGKLPTGHKRDRSIVVYFLVMFLCPYVIFQRKLIKCSSYVHNVKFNFPRWQEHYNNLVDENVHPPNGN